MRRKSKCVESVGLKWRGINVAIHDARQRGVEGISFGEMPDRKSQLSSGLEHSQHFANGVDRGRKEHHAKAADRGVESVGGKRQIVGEGHIKFCVLQAETLCLSASGGDHPVNRVNAEDFSVRTYRGRYA